MLPAILSDVRNCQILIIDDEPVVCDFLVDVLKDRYTVDCCYNAAEALKCIDNKMYDIIITDLKLADRSGIEILEYAKKKDPYTEVVIITGFGTLGSASQAINLGATSYLLKPLQVDDLEIQIDRAVASRVFHLKSLWLINNPAALQPDMHNHVQTITSLYFFSRKLMAGLEITEIMRLVLDELNKQFNPVCSTVVIKYQEFAELYCMPRSGTFTLGQAKGLIDRFWDTTIPLLDRSTFGRDELPLTVFKGPLDEPAKRSALSAQSIPIMSLGQTVGMLILYKDEALPLAGNETYFLHVFASMVSSVVEHAYNDIHAQMLARTDSLTGIANHRYFHEVLSREIARADRGKTAFGFMVLDIDDFKKINDSYGHPVGDEVIKNLTIRVNAMIRRGDLLARYGGEEFALILPDSAGLGAGVLAGRICIDLASNPVHTADKDISYTVSIGIAIYDGSNPCSKDLLIREADRALYVSKNNGKNQFTVA